MALSARPILNKAISRLSSESLSLNAEGVGGKRLPTATPKTSARIAIRLSVTGERRGMTSVVRGVMYCRNRREAHEIDEHESEDERAETDRRPLAGERIDSRTRK